MYISSFHRREWSSAEQLRSGIRLHLLCSISGRTFSRLIHFVPGYSLKIVTPSEIEALSTVMTAEHPAEMASVVGSLSEYHNTPGAFGTDETVRH